jgi:hypothetical protein
MLLGGNFDELIPDSQCAQSYQIDTVLHTANGGAKTFGRMSALSDCGCTNAVPQ